MISLKEYIFLEDENKFVKIDYKTTVNTEENDDVQISSPLLQDVEGEDSDLTITPPIEGGVDDKLVGEIRLYSETSSIFNERKRKIAEKFKNLLNSDEINANRIKCTKIFEYYINHLIKEYKKDVDENAKVNVSTKNELIRQISDDFVMILRNYKVLPDIS